MLLRFPHLSAALLITLLLPLVAAEPPTLQPDSLLNYLPSLPGNSAVASIYAVLSVIFFYLTFKTRAWWALCLPIATAFSAVGFGLRVLLRQNDMQSEKGVTTPMYLFVLLPPAAFLAFNYIVGGRLLVAVTEIGGRSKEDPTAQAAAQDGQRGFWAWRARRKSTAAARKKMRWQKSPFSLIPPRLYTITFVTSDIITFIIQGIGGSMQTAGSISSKKLGFNFFLAGVVLQTASYFFFVLIVLVSHIKLIRIDPDSYAFSGLFDKSRRNPAVVLFWTLHVTGIFFLIRSFFRVAEMAEGYLGKLFNVEIYTFLLDCLPLIIAILMYIPLWPSYLIDRTAPSPAVQRVVEEYMIAQGRDVETGMGAGTPEITEKEVSTR